MIMEPVEIKQKINTIHTARTMMFLELERIMDFSYDNDNYIEALNENVFGKKSSDGIRQTGSFLKRLYGFELNDQSFVVFKYLWKNTNTSNKPILALLLAIKNDDLLAESIQVLESKTLGEKVSIELFEEVIENFHPKKYTDNTRKSLAQNIASSWKQAGFILGKVKNIRVQPEIDYSVVAFALFLGYLDNLRGEFLFNSKYTRALSIPESKLRDLAFEASKRDLLSYQFAGSVTTITFNQLFKTLNING
jgi:hypothetical protein